MSFWLEMLAEFMGWVTAEFIAEKTPRKILWIIFIIVILTLGGLLIYYLL